MKNLTFEEIVNATAEHIWMYCMTYDGKHPDESKHINDMIDYPLAVKQAAPNHKVWIRGVKIRYSVWEEVERDLKVLEDLPPTYFGNHQRDDTMCLNREIQYNYMVTRQGYTPYTTPKHKMLLLTEYAEANVYAHRINGVIFIRSITIDYEPWLEIHPTDHPNPPETPVNAAGL